MTVKMTVEKVIFIMKKNTKAHLSDGFVYSFLNLEKSTKNHETVEKTDGTNDAFDGSIWTKKKSGRKLCQVNT